MDELTHELTPDVVGQPGEWVQVPFGPVWEAHPYTADYRLDAELREYLRRRN